MEMKYIWYWEWSYKDREKETELSTKFEEALKKTPEKFPKMGKSCHTGRGKGFRLIEAENEEQLTNLVGLWYPTENFKLVPYFYGPDLMGSVQKWSE